MAIRENPLGTGAGGRIDIEPSSRPSPTGTADSSATWRNIGGGVAASIVAFGAMLIATKAAGVPITYAVADQQQFTESRFIGVTTTAGLMVWAAALTACLFPLSMSVGTDRSFLWASAGLTFLLLLDDWLLIHEYVGQLPGPGAFRQADDLLEGAVFAVLAALFVWYAKRNWRRLTAARGRHYLAAALALFVASSAIDFLSLFVELDPAGNAKTLADLAEEGLKFAGIVFWLLFCWSIAVESLGTRDDRPDALQSSRT